MYWILNYATKKKNPDIMEITRGKCCVIIGKLFSFINIINSQTLSYNKDNQEDKLIIFSSYKIVKDTILVFIKVINNIEVNEKQSIKILNKFFCTSTDMADYLTKKGIPFKKSHFIISALVRKFLKSKKNINKVKNKDIKKIDLNSYYLLKKKI